MHRYKIKVKLFRSMCDIVSLPNIITRTFCIHSDKETITEELSLNNAVPIKKLIDNKSFILPGQNYRIPIKYEFGSGPYKRLHVGPIEYKVNTSEPSEKSMSGTSSKMINSSEAISNQALDGRSPSYECTDDDLQSSSSPPEVPVLPRPQRQEPGQTFFCIIPVEWAKAFNAKTGITGFWTLLFTTATYLVSKEIYVLEHNFYSGISMAILSYLGVTYIGPELAKSLDKDIDAYEAEWNSSRTDEMKWLNDQIADENKAQIHFAEQTNLVKAKRDMVDLQLEAEFRKRQMAIYKRVLNILDYQVEIDDVNQRFAHENMVQWLMEQVSKSLNDDFDAKYFDLKIKELESLGQQLNVMHS